MGCQASGPSWPPIALVGVGMAVAVPVESVAPELMPPIVGEGEEATGRRKVIGEAVGADKGDMERRAATPAPALGLPVAVPKALQPATDANGSCGADGAGKGPRDVSKHVCGWKP